MIGRTLLNRYKIEAELGHGGMGVVYRAHDRVLDRDVAIKVLSETRLGTEGRARLLREAQAVARLNHPNIVSVYDAGEADGAPFVVMELVDGDSLRRPQPRTPEQVIELAVQICRALEQAHGSGIIHRDLKLENILVTSSQTIKLMDFGLARTSDLERLTQEGGIVGTASYLAPELIQGQLASIQSDLYALGVMLYELVAGQAPFHGDTLMAILSQHLYAPVVPPSTYNATIPPALDRLILHLMSKQPEDRPATAAEVRLALEQMSAPRSSSTTLAAMKVAISPLERIVRGRLVGREVELVEANSLWQRAMTGESQVLLISGEPGIGKTRLAREVTTLAEFGHALVLVGECFSEVGISYDPLAQILASLPDELLANTPPANLADLIVLAPALRVRYPDVPPNPPLGPQAEMQRMFESFLGLFARLAEQAPVLLLIEDAHWSDGGTLALLRHVVRRVTRTPMRLMCVLTYREVELAEARALNDFLVEISREPLVTRVKLSRLASEQTRELLEVMFQDQISDEFLFGIYRETEGNPFFIEEVVKALIEEGKLYREEGRWQRVAMSEMRVPQSVRIVIEARLSKLPEADREILRLAAILGRRFDFETLKAAGDSSEEILVNGLERAERAQLISEVARSAGGTFSFAHALIPATLEEGLSGLRRRRLHRRVAEVMESQQSQDFAGLATHYSAAADDEKARQYFLRAGDQAFAALANADAEKHYRSALELSGDASQRGEALARLAVSLRAQAKYEESIQTFLLSVEEYRSVENFDQVGRYYGAAAWTAWNSGDTPRGMEISRQGWALLASLPDSPGKVALAAEAARQCYFNEFPEEGQQLAEQAAAMSKRLELLGLHVQSLVTLALFQNTEENLVTLKHAVELGREAARKQPGFDSGLGYSRGLNNLIEALAADGRYRESLVVGEEMLQINQDRGAAEMFALYQISNMHLILGELTKAEETLLRARRILNQLSQPGQVGRMIELLEDVLVFYRGDPQSAIQHLWIIFNEMEQGNDRQNLINFGHILAEAYIDLCEWQQAEAVLERILPIVERGVLSFRDGTRSYCFLSYVQAAQGKFSQAEAALEQARQRVETGGLPEEIRGDLRLAVARLAAVKGAWEEAFQAYQAAIQTSKRTERNWQLAQWLAEYAGVRLQRGQEGDEQQALDLLEESQHLFEQMGAPRRAGQVSARRQGLLSKGQG